MSFNSEENYERVKRVAVEVETVAEGAYIDGNGDVISELDYKDVPEDSQEDYEPYDISDWLSGSLSIEYTKTLGLDYLNGVRVYVGLGGPTVWVDTRDATVNLRWAVDEAECGISREACDAIEDVISEYLEA